MARTASGHQSTVLHYWNSPHVPSSLVKVLGMRVAFPRIWPPCYVMRRGAPGAKVLCSPTSLPISHSEQWARSTGFPFTNKCARLTLSRATIHDRLIHDIIYIYLLLSNPRPEACYIPSIGQLAHRGTKRLEALSEKVVFKT